MSLMFVSIASAGVWIRTNEAGYAPGRPVEVIVQSDTDIQNQPWILGQGAGMVLQGTLPGSFVGRGDHTAKDFQYRIALSDTLPIGVYDLELEGAAPARIHIAADPYSVRITQALRHLRVMRSGNEGILLHGPSHLGDSAAIVHVPSGALADGAWVPASPSRVVNMLGGHYDAGDYIKFTLNEAYLAYHLLVAYTAQPTLFPVVFSPSTLPDVLDEARHSLHYLSKTLPDANTFVIQVGSHEDHNQGARLPEADGLDGQRKALCALSRAHMGVTAAALAKGAQVFADLGQTAEAALYRERAIAIYARARQNDAVASAFERDQTNDFYHDPTDADNMALAAAELYALTQEAAYLQQAQQYAPAAGPEVSWTTWNATANLALAPFDASAAQRVRQEVDRYAGTAADHPWNLPGGYTWASLHRWIGAAHATARAHRLAPAASLQRAVLGVLDYTFGRNPWGVSFQFSLDLPNTVRNIYGQIYPLLGQFPTGAVSEGPGDLAMHTAMRQWFTMPTNDPLEEFNTAAAVFYDNGRDFMLQEATVGGQADLILLLALASPAGIVAEPDSGTTERETELPGDTVRVLPLTALTCYTFDDKGEGGLSEVRDYIKSADAVSMTLAPVGGGEVTYPYAGVDCKFAAGIATPFDLVILHMDIPQGQSLRVTFPQTDIRDYGYYGKDISGRGESDYVIHFSELEQAFGAAVALDPSKVNGIDLTASVSGSVTPVRILGVEFRGDDVVTSALGRSSSRRGPSPLRIRREGDLYHMQWQGTHSGPTEIRDSSGRFVVDLHPARDGSFVWNAVFRPAGVYYARSRVSGLSVRMVHAP